MAQGQDNKLMRWYVFPDATVSLLIPWFIDSIRIPLKAAKWCNFPILMCNQAAPCNLYLHAAMLIKFPFNIGWNGEHEAARAILDISSSRLRCVFLSQHTRRQGRQIRKLYVYHKFSLSLWASRLLASHDAVPYKWGINNLGNQNKTCRKTLFGDSLHCVGSFTECQHEMNEGRIMKARNR